MRFWMRVVQRLDPRRAAIRAADRHEAEGASYFRDWSNPKPEELRAWAYSGAYAPMQDFEMLLDDRDVMPTVIDCAEDPDCPNRQLLMFSLYCSVGHLAADDRTWIRELAAQATHSSDRAVRTWATRTIELLDGVRPLDRDEWCFIDEVPGGEFSA